VPSQGQLAQHFVVLKEKEGRLLGYSVAQASLRKRPLEDQTMAYEKNNGGGGKRGRGIARGKLHCQTKASRR
jgi:hypothetical protein